MKRRIALGIMVTLLLIGSTALTLNIQSAKMQSGTIYIRADGSIDPPTALIQRLGNTYTFTSNISDAIVVERDDIIIDGNGYVLSGPIGGGHGFHLSGTNNATVRNVDIKSFYIGIYLNFTSHCVLSGNNIGSTDSYTANREGVRLENASYTSICRNNITDNDYGILLHSSSTNRIYQNNMTSMTGSAIELDKSTNNDINLNNILGGGISLSSSSNNTVYGNIIGGVALVNSSYNTISGNSITTSAGLGYVGVALGGPNNIIHGNNITNNWVGIQLQNYERVPVPYGYEYTVVCYNNTISRNHMINNTWGIGGGDGMGVYSYNNTYSENTIANNTNGGISLYHAETNTFWGNTIRNNGGAGVSLTQGEGASNNIFYHNNFIDNTRQVRVYRDPNIWDNGYPACGNYWSNYTGQDANGDGIGDTPHVIDEKNRDRYPLMTPWTSSWTPPEHEPVTPTPNEVQVGVKVGDWIKCTYTTSGWSVGTPYPEWLRVEFLSVEGTTVTVRVTMRMSNGTELSETVPVDVVAGDQALGLSGLVIPADCAAGDSIYMSGYGNVTIEGETTRTYAGAGRTVVYASFSQYGTQLTYYWDKQTGIMVEATTISGSITASGKATETNMWEAVISPFWMQSWFYAIMAAIIVALAGTVYFLKKRKPPTPNATPLPTEST